jgi:hypothetical protein
MKKLVLLLGVVVSLVSCEGNMTATPCLGDCSAEFYVDSTVNEGSYVDENGFYVVKHSGFNYFSEFIVNGTPLVETKFDSDYSVDNTSNTSLPLNIVGYEEDGTTSGTFSRYTYTPQMSVLFTKNMVGDTANITIQTTFNNDVVGQQEIVTLVLPVIFK